MSSSGGMSFIGALSRMGDRIVGLDSPISRQPVEDYRGWMPDGLAVFSSPASAPEFSAEATPDRQLRSVIGADEPASRTFLRYGPIQQILGTFAPGLLNLADHIGGLFQNGGAGVYPNAGPNGPGFAASIGAGLGPPAFGAPLVRPPYVAPPKDGGDGGSSSPSSHRFVNVDGTAGGAGGAPAAAPGATPGTAAPGTATPGAPRAPSGPARPAAPGPGGGTRAPGGSPGAPGRARGPRRPRGGAAAAGASGDIQQRVQAAQAALAAADEAARAAVQAADELIARADAVAPPLWPDALKAQAEAIKQKAIDASRSAQAALEAAKNARDPEAFIRAAEEYAAAARAARKDAESLLNSISTPGSGSRPADPKTGSKEVNEADAIIARATDLAQMAEGYGRDSSSAGQASIAAADAIAAARRMKAAAESGDAEAFARERQDCIAKLNSADELLKHAEAAAKAVPPAEAPAEPTSPSPPPAEPAPAVGREEKGADPIPAAADERAAVSAVSTEEKPTETAAPATPQPEPAEPRESAPPPSPAVAASMPEEQPRIETPAQPAPVTPPAAVAKKDIPSPPPVAAPSAPAKGSEPQAVARADAAPAPAAAGSPDERAARRAALARKMARMDMLGSGAAPTIKLDHGAGGDTFFAGMGGTTLASAPGRETVPRGALRSATVSVSAGLRASGPGDVSVGDKRDAGGAPEVHDRAEAKTEKPQVSDSPAAKRVADAAMKLFTARINLESIVRRNGGKPGEARMFVTVKIFRPSDDKIRGLMAEIAFEHSQCRTPNEGGRGGWDFNQDMGFKAAQAAMQALPKKMIVPATQADVRALFGAEDSRGFSVSREIRV